MRTFDWLLEFGDLDWLAILVGTVVAMVLGFVWYGPLFGKIWARASGTSMVPSPEPGQLVLTAVYFFVFNIGLAYLGAIDDFEHALVTAIIVGLLLVAPALFSATVWAKKSPTVFLIDAVHWIVVTLACVYVQGLFV